MFENIFTQNSIDEIQEIFGNLDRKSVCVEFDNYSFYISNNKTLIKTRLNIKTIENNQIGWYEIETDFDDDLLDEFLNLY